jgi:CheY-like chemotaxis protein
VPATEPPVILVADDARVMRMLVRTWLERLGFSVLEAASGSEALAQTRKLRFDAAFLDIHMPGLTGLQVLDGIRSEERTAELPVVIVTTLGHAADVERGLRLGASAYLTKPLSYGDLVRALERVLPTRFKAGRLIG